MDAEREFIDVGALTAEVEDSNFGVGYTTVEAGLGVWLQDDDDVSHAMLSCSRSWNHADDTARAVAESHDMA